MVLVFLIQGDGDDSCHDHDHDDDGDDFVGSADGIPR